MTSSLAPSISEKEIHEDYLDGLRGLAILAVVLAHSMEHLPGPTFLSGSREIFYGGVQGVSLFFILSAFTLYRSTQLRSLKERLPKVSFALRRAFRILPFWWLNVILRAIWTKASFRLVLINIFFIFGFSQDIADILVPGSWSLFVEESFYAVAIFFFYKKLSLKGTLLTLLFTFLVAKFWWEIVPHFNWLNKEGPLYWANPLGSAYLFVEGVTLYSLTRDAKQREKLKALFKKYSWLIDLCSILGMRFLIFSIEPFGSFTLVCIFLSAMSDGPIWGRLSRNKFVRAFGVSCYSIYFLHVWILLIMDSERDSILRFFHLSETFSDVKLLFYFPLIAVLSLAIGLVTFLTIERPCVLVGKKCLAHLNEAK